MLRCSDEYPQRIIIQNSSMNLELYVHKFFPIAKPKLRKVLIMMSVNEFSDELQSVCKWLLNTLQDDLKFYELHSYNKEYNQLEQNIQQIKFFIGA